MFRSSSIDAEFLKDDKAKSKKEKIFESKIVPEEGESPRKEKDVAMADLVLLDGKGMLVESQMIDSVEFNAIKQSSKQIPASSTPPIQMMKTPPINKKSTMEEDDSEQEQLHIAPIMIRNGWERKVETLLTHNSPIKESRTEGKEQRAPQTYSRLMKLDAMGGDVVSSILPEDLQ